MSRTTHVSTTPKQVGGTLPLEKKNAGMRRSWDRSRIDRCGVAETHLDPGTLVYRCD